MKSRLRVVHIVPAPFGEGGVIGGAERYALELARHMSGVTPTTLVSFGDRPRDGHLGRLRIRVLGPAGHVRGQCFNPIHPGVIRAIAETDIVHCHQRYVLVNSLSAALCRVSGRRVFVSDLGGGGWDVSAYLSTERWYHGHLHISEYSRRVAGHSDSHRARVISGGVDTQTFLPDPSVTRDGVVRFVGRLMPHKGVNDLVTAMPPDMALELIGRPYHPGFVGDLHRLASGKCVSFRHDCTDADLVTAYRRSLCVVLPSVYRDMYGGESRVPELLGQTLLEAMACATPVVCTDVASMPEVVADGETGFVVPPNDPAALREKLVWLRDHPTEARAMGEAGRQRVLKLFTWDRVVARCMSEYVKA